MTWDGTTIDLILRGDLIRNMTMEELDGNWTDIESAINDFSDGGKTELHIVVDETERLALSPTYPIFAFQEDSNELYVWDGLAWNLIAGGAVEWANILNRPFNVDTVGQEVFDARNGAASLDARLDVTDTIIAGKIDSTEKGVANGVATLDASGLVPESQLPEISTLDSTNTLMSKGLLYQTMLEYSPEFDQCYFDILDDETSATAGGSPLPVFDEDNFKWTGDTGSELTFQVLSTNTITVYNLKAYFTALSTNISLSYSTDNITYSPIADIDETINIPAGTVDFWIKAIWGGSDELLSVGVLYDENATNSSLFYSDITLNTTDDAQNASSSLSFIRKRETGGQVQIDDKLAEINFYGENNSGSNSKSISIVPKVTSVATEVESELNLSLKKSDGTSSGFKFTNDNNIETDGLKFLKQGDVSDLSLQKFMPTYLIKPDELCAGKDYYGNGCRPVQFTPGNGSPIWMNEAGGKVIGTPGLAYDHAAGVGSTSSVYGIRHRMVLPAGKLKNMRCVIATFGTPGLLTWRIRNAALTELASGTIDAASSPAFGSNNYELYPTREIDLSAMAAITEGDHWIEFEAALNASNYWKVFSVLNNTFTQAALYSDEVQLYNNTSWNTTSLQPPVVQLTYEIDSDTPHGWAFNGAGSNANREQAITAIDADCVQFSSKAGTLFVDALYASDITDNYIAIVQAFNDVDNWLVAYCITSDDTVYITGKINGVVVSTTQVALGAPVLGVQHQFALIYNVSDDGVFSIKLLRNGVLIDSLTHTEYVTCFNASHINVGVLQTNAFYYPARGTVNQVAYWPYDASEVLPELVNRDVRTVVGQPVHRPYTFNLFLRTATSQSSTLSGKDHRFPTNLYRFVLCAEYAQATINWDCELSGNTTLDGAICEVLAEDNIRGSFEHVMVSGTRRNMTCTYKQDYCGLLFVCSGVYMNAGTTVQMAGISNITVEGK